ncbi:MAG: glycosyltransferase family 2 protein [Sphingobacteriia bacterium]|nr:MAG: glycosyltransferase family 2 protein [Sphingobacteriia bacterium]
MSVAVAIVILNYNGRNYLEQFLPSVMATNYPELEVVVADNGSTDDSVAYIQRVYPSITVLQNTRNDGFAGGYNWALQRVKSDYYILLNSDVEVTCNWVSSIIQLMEADKSIAACQPKILSFKDPASFEYAGAAGGWIDYLGYPFSRGRVFDICEQDLGQYNKTEPIFWATGAAMFVRSSVFHEMKGFDPYFFAHQEEIDLCWRMQIAGYGIMACTDSVVYHMGAGTLPRGGKKVYLNFRNNLIMISKNLPWRELWWKLPYRFLLDAVSAWKGLFTGDFYFFTAIVKAHIAFLYWFITRFDRSTKPKPALLSLKGVYAGSVVWKYFFEGKQRFLEIISTKPR